jgi:DNA-binding response OmpR family regulator
VSAYAKLDDMGMSGTPIATKILVVEDDPAIARILSRLLTRLGSAVVHAADGSEGVGAFDRETPDLVVLDLGLPGLDGWEVLRHIRSSSSVPVVIVTSDVHSHDRSLDEGANAFLSKPFNNDELVAEVGSLLVG